MIPTLNARVGISHFQQPFDIRVLISSDYDILSTVCARTFTHLSAAEDDGLAHEDIVQVRECCRKMVAAVETAGGKCALEGAREALLATALETYPGFDAGELETFLSRRGLVSDRK